MTQEPSRSLTLPGPQSMLTAASVPASVRRAQQSGPTMAALLPCCSHIPHCGGGDCGPAGVSVVTAYSAAARQYSSTAAGPARTSHTFLNMNSRGLAPPPPGHHYRCTDPSLLAERSDNNACMRGSASPENKTILVYWSRARRQQRQLSSH